MRASGSLGSLRVVCLPSADGGFRDVVQQVVTGQAAPSSPAELRVVLQPLFPAVDVRARDLSGEPGSTWYVYRDGGVGTTETGWWEGPDVGRAWLDAATGRFLAIDPVTAGVLGRRGEELIGHSYLELIEPDGRELAADLWGHLVRDGEIETIVGVQRADGTTVMVEAWARLRDGMVEGRYREVGVLDVVRD